MTLIDCEPVLPDRRRAQTATLRRPRSRHVRFGGIAGFVPRLVGSNGRSCLLPVRIPRQHAAFAVRLAGETVYRHLHDIGRVRAFRRVEVLPVDCDRSVGAVRRPQLGRSSSGRKINRRPSLPRKEEV
jgi:hypothetical protein